MPVNSLGSNDSFDNGRIVQKEPCVKSNENDRLITFSDGVIAITITLMAFEIRLPDSAVPWTDATLWQALLDLSPQYRAYLLSFLVIGVFWLGHRSKFTHITRHSQALVWLNMLFLCEIGFMPFATDVLAQSGERLATILYAGTVATISLTSGAMTFYAMRAGLAEKQHDAMMKAMLSILTPALVFCLSIPIALFEPRLAQLSWLLLIPANILAGRFGRQPQS